MVPIQQPHVTALSWFRGGVTAVFLQIVRWAMMPSLGEGTGEADALSEDASSVVAEDSGSEGAVMLSSAA